MNKLLHLFLSLFFKKKELMLDAYFEDISESGNYLLATKSPHS